MIQVREQNLSIDVLDELEPYEFSRGRNRGTEFTACSPFRNESSPSFSINLETGQWIDFGSSDGHMAKGSLVLLLSHLRNEPFEDTESYLIGKYGLDLSNVDNFKLNVVLDDTQKAYKTISLDDYKRYAFRHPYLSTRGITERVQTSFKIGYDKRGNAIAMPWFDKDGKIINIKFRKVAEKKFYYAEGQAIRNHLYGLNFIHKMNLKRAYIVESEIDCLYLWSCGVPAIAIGGSNLTQQQRRLILLSPLEELVIATDNDEVGDKVKRFIIKNLLGSIELYEFPFPAGRKDINELSKNEMADSIKAIKKVGVEGFLIDLSTK